MLQSDLLEEDKAARELLAKIQWLMRGTLKAQLRAVIDMALAFGAMNGTEPQHTFDKIMQNYYKYEHVEPAPEEVQEEVPEERLNRARKLLSGMENQFGEYPPWLEDAACVLTGYLFRRGNCSPEQCARNMGYIWEERHLDYRHMRQVVEQNRAVYRDRNKLKFSSLVRNQRGRTKRWQLVRVKQ